MQALPATNCQLHTSTSSRLHLRSGYPQVVRRNGAGHNCRRVELQKRVTCAAGAIKPYYDENGKMMPGPSLANKTYYPKLEDTSKLAKNWYVIDAEGQTLGRMACLAATHLRGKANPAFSPSMDMGDFVIIINAEKVVVSGNKYEKKKYFRHTNGRPGHYKIELFKDLQKRIPERIVEKAIKGMLPKGRLGKTIFHNLKVYKGPKHPHEAQQPVDITDRINKKFAPAVNA